jgi:type I restriction enzyme R subunit
MPPPDLNELTLAEEPAVRLLAALGYGVADSAAVAGERTGLADPLLTRRVEAALRRLNPWLSAANVRRAVRRLRDVQGPGLIEANAAAHVAIVHGIALDQDLGRGTQGQTVRYVDFDDASRNELLAVRQFRVKTAQREVVCDLVVFVNGLPWVVIECKSPTVRNALDEARGQVCRYQELGEDQAGRGMPVLFPCVQLVVAACGQAARFGTVGTPPESWSEWKTAYPQSLDELQRLLGHIPTPQDVLLAGMLRPETLLDIVRGFTVFEAVHGRLVRKVCRYPQFVAVREALARIRSARRPERRGGVIWHTQGSGKSLTMLFLAMALRRLREAGNPALAIVTDRLDLHEQITATFTHCGFPNPEPATSVQHLRELLRRGQGQTVTTTIQKFQEATEGLYPVLNESPDVFVLVDEAHRTQYRSLAANLRRALPNACFIGFTGTPIDRKDRSTFRTFGPYIHAYTIEQSVADGATVPIHYELRNSQDRVEGDDLDAVFERVFAERTEAERAAIKQRYATREAIAGAPQRIERISRDLLGHYRAAIQPNGFKAQVVACSRHAAATYRDILGGLAEGEVELVVSFAPNDGEHIARWAMGQAEQRRAIGRFKDPSDPLRILVVCDMLLTGFDAPVEQVLYLDAPLKDHNLLQAIARVNRPAPGKTHGLVVDYWGVAADLPRALADFAPEEVGPALRPVTDELPRLESRHRTAMRFFAGIPRSDLDRCVAVLEPEDTRAEFEFAFRRFSQSLDMLLPDPAALPYLDDLRWLGKVRNAARLRFRDARLDLPGCQAKVRHLIEEHIRSEGVESLLPPVSILAPEFEERLAAIASTEARASEMEHALRYEIQVHFGENPAFYGSLRERLETLIRERDRSNLDAAEQLAALTRLREHLRQPAKQGLEVGLDATGVAVYDAIGRETDEPLAAADGEATYRVDSGRRDLANAILEELRALTVVDWVHKEDVQRRMRQATKRHLRRAGIAAAGLEAMTDRVMELARTRLA